jgi:hypothetical protein
VRHALACGIWMMNILVANLSHQVNVCEGIDDSSRWGEPILINNCSTLLNANMSQVRNGLSDLM